VEKRDGKFVEIVTSSYTMRGNGSCTRFVFTETGCQRASSLANVKWVAFTTWNFIDTWYFILFPYVIFEGGKWAKSGERIEPDFLVRKPQFRSKSKRMASQKWEANPFLLCETRIWQSYISFDPIDLCNSLYVADFFFCGVSGEGKGSWVDVMQN